MNTHEIIGMMIFGFVLLLATAQAAFAWGRIVGTRSERQLADRRVQGVIASENERNPRQRKRLVYRKVDARKVGTIRFLNSRLPGVEVTAL
jgi:hypothetical protein